jgi:FkbM family methyltransferase
MSRSKLLRIPFLNDLLLEEPFVVVDVGASGGMSGKWPSIGAPIHYVGFEPDETQHARLVAGSDPKRETYIKMGVGGAKGDVDFHVTRMQACSSVLHPNAEFVAPFRPTDFEIERTIRIQVDTLDRLLEDAHVRKVDFLKLDTQGSELDILRGATETLRDVFAIDVEVEFQPLYQAQPLFGEVDRHLRGCGFECFDLYPRYWKRSTGRRYGGHKGQIIFAEALYLRGRNHFRQLSFANRLASDRARICKAVVICSMYGYLDYADELLSTFSKLFSTDEIAELRRAFTAETPFTRKLPNFRGKRRLAKLFLDLHYVFRF